MIKGTFIPGEFYKIKELNGVERDVLALYKYYTENGEYKCCCLNNTQIAEYFDVSPRHIREIKKHLKELGFISTDGGICVKYTGVQVGAVVPTIGAVVPTIGAVVPTK